MILSFQDPDSIMAVRYLTAANGRYAVEIPVSLTARHRGEKTPTFNPQTR